MEGLAVSISAWVIFGVGLLIRWRLKRAKTIRSWKFYYVISATLTFVIGAAMAEIIIGEGLANLFRWFGETVGSAIGGAPSGVILAIAAAVAVFFIVVGLSDRQADPLELMLLLILPTLFAAAAGSGISGQGSQLAEAALNLVTGGLGAVT